jgi:hypothetical protein
MKKNITILTAFILMFALTVTTGCKKDNRKNPVNPTKTTKQVVIENEWIFKQGSLLRTTDIDRFDTIIKFNLDSTIKVSIVRNDTFINDISFRYTHYSISNDSVYGTLVYPDRNYWDDSLFYSMKRESNNDLVGTKIQSFHLQGSQYIRTLPVNVRIGIR